MTTADLLKKAQTIKAPDGEEMVILPKAVFDELSRAFAETEEDADDVAIYDARKATASDSVAMPAEVTMALLRGDRRLKAIRHWRKVTQQRLAQDAGIAQGHLSDLETGRRGLPAATAKAIAKALDVPVGWISD